MPRRLQGQQPRYQKLIAFQIIDDIDIIICPYSKLWHILYCIPLLPKPPTNKTKFAKRMKQNQIYNMPIVILQFQVTDRKHHHLSSLFPVTFQVQTFLFSDLRTSLTSLLHQLLKAVSINSFPWPKQNCLQWFQLSIFQVFLVVNLVKKYSKQYIHSRCCYLLLINPLTLSLKLHTN